MSQSTLEVTARHFFVAFVFCEASSMENSIFFPYLFPQVVLVVYVWCQFLPSLMVHIQELLLRRLVDLVTARGIER